MSLRRRWDTLSLTSRERILRGPFFPLAPMRAYGPRLMARRQTAFQAYVDPDSQPEEIDTMRSVLGPVLNRASAARVWALRHQLRVLEALRASPSPRLP